MNRVLLDSDVILDLFLDRKPFSDFSVEVLFLCESGKIDGYVTPVIVSNCYYILRKSAKHSAVIQKLKQLLSIVNVLAMDSQSVLKSLDSDFSDFEDALQNYSAELSGLNAILTRNIKDYKNSKLAILTPEHFCKALG